MIIVLAGGNLVVMAAETIGRNGSVVDVNRFPVRSVVAISAGGAGRRMIFQLSLRHAAVMALLTFSRHTFENRSSMAGFARYSSVGALEWKAS